MEVDRYATTGSAYNAKLHRLLTGSDALMYAWAPVLVGGVLFVSSIVSAVRARQQASQQNRVEGDTE
jgi:hypothetical protein